MAVLLHISNIKSQRTQLKAPTRSRANNRKNCCTCAPYTSKARVSCNFPFRSALRAALNSADRLRSVFACSVKYLSCYVLIKHIFRSDKEPAQVSSKHAEGLRVRHSYATSKGLTENSGAVPPPPPPVPLRLLLRFLDFISDICKHELC